MERLHDGGEEMRRDNLRAVVGAEMLKYRNRWVGLTEISYSTEASPRQVSSILSQIPDAKMEFIHCEWGRAVMLSADDEEAKRIWGHIMFWRYHIDDVYGLLLDRIPASGWISIRDLAADAHMMQADVLECVKWMGDAVQTKGTNKQMLCHRTTEQVSQEIRYDVSEHKGAAIAGDVGTERR